MCVFLYFLYRCPRGQQPIFPPLNRVLSPTTYRSNRGSPFSFPPYPPANERRKETRTETKTNNRTDQSPRPPTAPSPPDWARSSPRPPPRPFPPSWATGISCSGDSGAAAPFSLRGRGGDFHLHASWWASLLAAQVLARAPWDPPQLAHFVATSSRSAPLNRAPVVMRSVVLRADGTFGVCRTMWGKVSPGAAPAAKSVQPSPLVGVDLVSSSRKSGSTLAKAAESRLAKGSDR